MTSTATPSRQESRTRGVAAGVVVIVASGLAALVLWTQDTSRVGLRAGTLYPPADWVLLAGMAVCGVALIVAPRLRDRLADVAAGAGLVAAAQLAGTGVVAFKHWRPYVGMSGHGDRLTELKVLAVVLACAGLAASLAFFLWLVAARSLPVAVPGVARVTCAVAGLVVVVGLPVGIAAGRPELMDLTSLGAFALIYSLPWGLAAMLSGWLARPAATGALAAVLVSMGLALRGPQMASLVFSNPTPAFVGALFATCVALAVRVRV